MLIWSGSFKHQSQKYPKNPNNFKSESIIYTNLRVDPEHEGQYSLNSYAKNILENGGEYYFVYGKTQKNANPKEKEEANTDDRIYEEIKKYMFYESGQTWVKVRIDLKAVGKLPKESIIVEFGVRSLDVKLIGFEGKNLRLRVPKTHYPYKPEGSKYLVKDDKIIVSLKKRDASDTWNTLHKQEMIGEGLDDK